MHPMTTPTSDVPAMLKQASETVTGYFQQLPARLPGAPPRLVESVTYSLMAGGKRLRPALVLETGRAVSGVGSFDQLPKSVHAAAAAIELIHTFSLVHDDLPAMDNDDLRRGRPTNHKVFGEAMAILAGDAMVTLAFEVLASDAEASVLPGLVKELANASGPEGMIGGQVLDMDGENRHLELAELQQIHRLKTGALLRAACRLGAIAVAASEPQLAAISNYGRHLGLAFQIVDDILDVTSTPAQMGKATGKDAGKGKNTYPSLMGLERSEQEARAAVADAVAALDGFGPSADGLRNLAKFVVDRRA
jgi:geranylgeranyl diphosphate synthase type II